MPSSLEFSTKVLCFLLIQKNVNFHSIISVFLGYGYGRAAPVYGGYGYGGYGRGYGGYGGYGRGYGGYGGYGGKY